MNKVWKKVLRAPYRIISPQLTSRNRRKKSEMWFFLDYPYYNASRQRVFWNTHLWVPCGTWSSVLFLCQRGALRNDLQIAWMKKRKKRKRIPFAKTITTKFFFERALLYQKAYLPLRNQTKNMNHGAVMIGLHSTLLIDNLSKMNFLSHLTEHD